MWLLSWLRKPKRSDAALRPPAHRAPRKAAAFRPRLEALEARCLLSGGVLDPAFGSGGLATTTILGRPSEAYAVATYPSAGTANDGKVVTAGDYIDSGGSYEFAIARYNLNGTLDTSFGGSGAATGPKGIAFDVKVQPDGKVVAAGWSGDNFAVARYNADGRLDSTFGGKTGKGVVSTDINLKSTDGASRLLLQPDGKIVVAGWTAPANTTSYDLALVRYNSDGSPDASFGSGGKVIQHFASPLAGLYNHQDNELDMALDAGTGALDPNAGKIVVSMELHTGKLNATVVRFNGNGSPDTSFGGGTGTVSLSTPTAHAVAVQPDDRVVVAGGLSGPGMELVRLNPDGTPDTTFGSGGLVQTPESGDAFAWSLAVQPDGKLVAAGYSYGNYGQFVVARYNGADGSPDGSFGVNGVAFAGTHIDLQTPFQSVDVALEPDGRIVLAGTTSANPSSFALARFLAAGPQVGSFTASPDPVTAGSSTTLAASNITDANPGAAVTRVAFYLDSNGDGKLEPSTDQLLGYATQTSPGVWTFAWTVALAPGDYTLFGQAQDDDGALGDPLALTFQVL